MSGRDSRPYSKKATISWNPGWMGLRDRHGDIVGEWAEKEDFSHFRCRWCQKVNKSINIKIICEFSRCVPLTQGASSLY